MSREPRRPRSLREDPPALEGFGARKRLLDNKRDRWAEVAAELSKLAHSRTRISVAALPHDLSEFLEWLLIQGGLPGIYLDSIRDGADRNDARAIAREALKIKHAMVDSPASTKYQLRANGGRRAAAARATNPELAARLKARKLADYEKAKGITLTSKSSVESREKAARASHQSLRNLNRILKDREAKARS